ncbi:MAG: hypothetical protein JWP06_763 [Candidatus Saccharibacteria bacterium]|nr:hypothetical protein [Candidatus Saccharibacteria bacterium]
MARLPQPGADNGTWGGVLNDFLEVAHNTDGTLKTGVSADVLIDGATNKVFTNTEKNKLATLAAVAVSGSYSDLTNKPLVANPTLVIAADAPASWQAAAGVHLDGSNDSAALSTAINSGAVILSPGTFTLSSPITITIVNPQVVGQGWSSVIKIANGMNNWAMIFNPGGQGTRGLFSNFTLDGNSSNQTAGGGIHASGAVQSEFHFMHFTNCYTAGLWLDAFPSTAFGHHNKVISCLFDATIASPGLGHGVLINSNDENYIRSEFQFLGGTGTPTYAIRDLTGLNTFQGSVFVGGRNDTGGIELRDGQRSRVLNCVFDGVSGTNVFIASSSGHNISNNVFTSIADQAASAGTYSGIRLEFAVKECIITGNILESSPTAGRTRSLIREDGSGGTGVNIVKDNVLRQSGAGTLSSGFTEMGGTGSRVTDNAINGTIV